MKYDPEDDTPEGAPLRFGADRPDAKKINQIRHSHAYKQKRAQFRLDCKTRNAPCHLCFGPGTLVRTYDGYTPIEDVVVGQRVLSSDGTWQTVREVLSRKYGGTAYWLRTSTMTRPVLVTPEHPILSLKSDHNHRSRAFSDEHGPFCSPGLCRPKSWAIGPQGAQVKIPNTDGRMRGRSHTIGWTEAQDLRRNSWVVTVAPTANDEVFELTIPFKPGRMGATIFELTDDFLWMVGLYLAEGSVGTGGINFSLHRDEVGYQQRLIRLFTTLGFNPFVQASQGMGVNVFVSSTNLAEWFPTLFGSGCHNKRIPEMLMRLPSKQARVIAQGVIDGDGRSSRGTLTQTSEILALQIAEIFARDGDLGSVTSDPTPPPAPSGRPRKPTYTTRWQPITRQQSARWQLDGVALARVRTNEPVNYTGPVYNLSVTGNNTYVVQNIAVHNCREEIDYRLKEPHPYSWTLDHLKPVQDHPELIMEISNFAASHRDCNVRRGTDEPAMDLGIPSEVW